MAESARDLKINTVIVKPKNYEKIVRNSSSTNRPYTLEELEIMYARAWENNCAIFITYMTPEILED